MHVKEILEEIEFLIAELNELNNLIIVEGAKDRIALRNLGVKNEIIIMNLGNGIVNFCERIAAKYKDIILLTDWDKKGSKLMHQLKRAFDSNGVRCNIEFRNRLAALCQKEIKDVESLPAYVARQKSRCREK